jgi:diguanylate cyclase (GGDEF)-like protein
MDLHTWRRSADRYKVERSRLADRLPPPPDDIGQPQPDVVTLVDPRFRVHSFSIMASAAGLFVVYLIWQVTRLGGVAHTTLIGDAFFIPMDLLVIYSTITASRRCRLDRKRFWSWALVSFAMVGYLIGNVLQLYQEGILHFPDSPDWSDTIYFAFFFAGLVGFGIGSRGVIRRWLFALDTLTIALSASAVLWYFVVGPTATQGDSLHEVLYAVLYPLGDLILLLAAVWTLQRGVPSSSLRAVRMITVGIFFYVVAVTLEGYLALHGGYHGGDHVDIVGMAAAMFFAIAGALQPTVKGQEPKNSPFERTGSASISYAALAVVFALVFVIQRHERIFPNLSILGVAVLAVIFVTIAQILSRGAFLEEQVKNEDLLGDLRHQAFHDSLTGLANRALFSERLEHALDRRRSFSTQHAVLMIDLNGFKSVNDSLGHEAGDEVLRVVAGRLRSAIRRGDTVARFGGDEFAILFEDVIGEETTVELVEHLLDVVRQPITIANRNLEPEASVGIALTGEEPLAADELLRYADTAMYQAKQQPHGPRYCVFETEMQTALAARVELEADLQGAVGRGELRVLYQPILDLASEKVIDFEALVRWMHPSRGLLPPAAFLRLAEQGGLIHEIDTWVLHQACVEASRWQHESPQFAQIGVHVNLSPLRLREPDLVGTIAEALSVAGLEPRFLTLELLESSVVDDLELARARLTELKALGLRIAVDDFGTGFSSLSHLRTLPIDVLKIDRSFISVMETSPQASTLVHSLIQLGAALGMDTVAEGIEEAEQLKHLREDECLHGQGYLFARPLDPDDLRSYLLESVGGCPTKRDRPLVLGSS